MYSHTQKITYKKNVSVFSTHTKKYYVIHAKKLLVFFPIQKNYYVLHAHKKLPYKKITSIFSHTKNYYVVHSYKKLPYKKLPYKKFTMYSHTQKITIQKNVSVFSTHTKKLLVFSPIQKITMYYTQKKSHTKKMLVFFPYKKLLCSALIQKIY